VVEVAQPEGDPAGGPLALGGLVDEGRRVALHEHVAAVADVVTAGPQEPGPETPVGRVDQM